MNVPLPSERDWEVYRFVTVQLWPLDVAADEFRISPAQVCQIVERTKAFILSTTPVPSKEDDARRLAVARQVAVERLDYLCGEAIRCFHRSKGVETIDRLPHGHGKTGCTTTRVNHGDARYLNVAGRLILLAAKLPVPRVWDGAECDREHDRSQAEQPPREELQTPPDGDCSSSPAEPLATEPTSSAPVSSTAATMLSCVEQARAEQTAAVAISRPVQTPTSDSQRTPRKARREAFFQTG